MRKGILLILDGYGESDSYEYNAVKCARTPFLHGLRAQSHSMLNTHGETVGLFADEMGGSEVGHTTIGAGRVVPSTAKKIHDDIESDIFKKNKVLTKILKEVKADNANIHFVGMLSDKNIHSDYNHVVELVKLAQNKAKHIFLHLITDGRDCGTTDSLNYLSDLLDRLQGVKNYEIASVSGRFYAMDREGNLDRTERAFKAMFGANHTTETCNVERYIKANHDQNISDEYIEPIHIKTTEDCGVKSDDYVFFFNFREDRLRQIAKMVDDVDCKLATMSSVAGVSSVVLYPTVKVKDTLSEHLSNLDLSQVKISESTKYPHVTYFLNGGEETPFKREDRIHIPTIKVKNFSKTPKMRAKAITKSTIDSIDKQYDAVIVNFSNPDMVGHTGNYKATVKALEYLDKCVKKICDKALKEDYFVLLTADHGNAEQMADTNGKPHTAHTLNDVMCVVVDREEHEMKEKGTLRDVAPTFLDLMDIEPNKKFEGESLVVN